MVKKGQVHVSETILVLFVVVIILMMGVTIYFKFSVEKSKTLAEELSCEGLGCMDTSKFLPFKRVLGEDFGRYKRMFGRKRIVVKELYPVDDSVKEVECDVVKYIQMAYPQNCGSWVIYDYNPENEPAAKVSTIVSLYYPEFDEYRVGRLEIEHYGDIRR